MRKFKLLKDHPYTEKGTIVEERGRDTFRAGSIDLISPETCFSIPIAVMDAWLEEVKEVTFSAEQIAAIKAHCGWFMVPGDTKKTHTIDVEWLDSCEDKSRLE